jgi:hypothetical protein
MANKLYEFTSQDAGNIVVESINGGKDLCMSGLLIQGDVQNQNGRIYPKDEIHNAVMQISEKITSGYSVLGELDHPEELSINLDRVSHIITKMWVDGSNGYGKLKLLPTPVGNIARSMLEAGVKLGVSSRGSGNVGNNGLVSDFEIITVDIVAQPSAPDAYPRTIYESLYNTRGGAQIHRLAEESMHDSTANKCLDKDILKFINNLKI